MRPIALCLLLLPLLLAAPARADEAAKDAEIARLKVELERLKEEIARLKRELEAARAQGAGVAPRPEGLETTAGQETSREQLKYLHYLGKSYKPAAGQPQHPALDGKRFVLHLVAVNQLERTNDAALKMLFSPGDKTRAFPGLDAYKVVTSEALATRSFPELTSYAGRRNADPALKIGPQSPPATTALYADLAYPDGALVAFLDGKVRWMTRRDLGLSPTDPVIAGPASKSPLLQTLSSE